MGQAIDWVSVTPPTADGTYKNVDLSAVVPSGTTGVCLNVAASGGTGDASVFVTPTGVEKVEIDVADAFVKKDSQTCLIVKLDGSYTFDIKLESGFTYQILVTYAFGSEATFLSGVETEIAKTTSDTWEAADISGTTGTAALAFGNAFYDGAYSDISWRYTGSSDDFSAASELARTCAWAAGTDATPAFDHWWDGSGAHTYLLGYVSSEYTPVQTGAATATDITPVGTGVFEDILTLTTGQLAAVLYYSTTSSSPHSSVGPKGNTNVEAKYTDRGAGIIITGGDPITKTISAKVQSATPKIYLLGYLTEGGASPSIAPLVQHNRRQRDA